MENAKKIQVSQAINKYHKYSFKLKHLDTLDEISLNKIVEMEKYVKMMDELIQLIKQVEGIEWIESFIANKNKHNYYCSISTYYYRKNKINNILWKYLFDC